MLRSIANGATIEIADITVGDIVYTHDPETGMSGAREVLATWPHTDTLVEFEVGDSTVTTTEDHEFWNVTDQAWQETQHIDAGDLLLTADGATVEAGTLLWDTAHVAPAFDLTIDEIHTYHVTAGDESVLVHNQNRTCNVDEDGNVRLVNDDGSEVFIRVDGKADYTDPDGRVFDDVLLDPDNNPTFDTRNGQPQPAPPSSDRLDEIINDHAFVVHREEFEKIGLQSEAEIKAHAEAVIENPDRFGYQDRNDARWWYDEESRVIVFDDPTAVGTAFPAEPGYVLPDRTPA